MTNLTLQAAGDPFEWSEILARGADAESFLQGQLSQDVTNIGQQGTWSLLLSPSSTVLTSLLVRRDDEGFSLLVPRSLAEVAHARLRRFLLRTACTLEVRDASHGPVDTIGEQVRSALAGPNEFAAELTPQSFGAAFVAATVSFTKGCFTGQELVGRLDARGSSVPWRYVRCQGPSVAQIDQVLRRKGPDGPRGVTTAVEDNGRVSALGFIHRSALDGTPSVSLDGVLVEAIG